MTARAECSLASLSSENRVVRPDAENASRDGTTEASSLMHMDDPLVGIRLNDNQRRHFEVLLSRLEDSLATIEALLASPRPRQLTQLADDVSPDFRALAEAEFPRLRGQVERMAVALGLRPNIVSLRRIIGAALTTDAVRVEDSLSSQMRGYGAVDPSLAERLDPALLRLAESLEYLASALRR